MAYTKIGPPQGEFSITVPDDFDSKVCISAHAEKTRAGIVRHYHDSFSDENFGRPSNSMRPKETYSVRIYPILGETGEEERLGFLRQEGAVLVGAQGIVLVEELAREELPRFRNIRSLDEPDFLPVDEDGDRRVPWLCKTAEKSEFGVGYSKGIVTGGYLLGFFRQ